MVADMVSASGTLDWSRISPLLPSEVWEQITAVQPPQVWLGSDTPGWRWTENWPFTTSSTYSYLSDLDFSVTDPIWKKVWVLSIPQRVKTFLWITLHNHNLKNAERLRRYLSLSTACDICGFHMDDMDHALRHCVAARGLWMRVLHPDLMEEFMLALFDAWLKRNLAPATIDSIHGIEECRRVFNNKLRHSGSEVLLSYQWSHLAPGWVKCNVDATLHTASGQATIGGLIMDEHGVWIVGFTRAVGRCSVLIAELWSLHDMLARAWSFGFRRLVVETDSLEEAETLPSPPSSLVAEINMDKSSPMCDSLVPHDWFGEANVVFFNL
ncbi:hypothetical protein V6N12_065476 [Hibiscus sabdariffa]|uniref:Uncharacterized protein n=1 Tax=Hibiscus sabdariffa TaxID=183260 RepID=A0ABR2G9M0_9ROSI